jgi:hypothetical protein
MLLPDRSSLGWKPPPETRENLYHELEQRGYVLRLLHPGQTHHFHQQRGLRAKTDRLDAMTIARTLLSGEARMGYVPSEQVATSARTRALAYAPLGYSRRLSKRDPGPDRGTLPRIHTGLCRSLLTHCSVSAEPLSRVLKRWSKPVSNPFSSCYEHSQWPITGALPPRNWWPWRIRA